jgi:hypothetical protein
LLVFITCIYFNARAHGGGDVQERMALLIERDPVLFVKDSFDMSRPQARQK